MSDVIPVSIVDILKNTLSTSDWNEVYTPGDWQAGIAYKVSDPQFMDLLEDMMANGQRRRGGWHMGNGHHRFAAALLLGWDTILTIEPDDFGDTWHPDSNDCGWKYENRSCESSELSDMVLM